MAERTIDYYLSLASPFTYLGHRRFGEVVARQEASVRLRPVDMPRVFAAAGGLPVHKRPPQRQAYRLLELRRWSEYLGIALNPEPRHFPVPDEAAARVVLAAVERGGDADALALAFMRAVWAEERNIAEADTIRAIVGEAGADEGLIAEAEQPRYGELREAYTAEAIDRQVFGAPTYFYRDEPFWGQDRLELLEWRLGQG